MKHKGRTKELIMTEDKKVLASNNLMIQKCFDIINSGDFYSKALKNQSEYRYYYLYKKSTQQEVCVVQCVPNALKKELELIVNGIRFKSGDTYQGVDFSDLQILYDVCEENWNVRLQTLKQGAMDYLNSICDAPKQKEQPAKVRKVWFFQKCRERRR